MEFLPPFDFEGPNCLGRVASITAYRAMTDSQLDDAIATVLIEHEPIKNLDDLFYAALALHCIGDQVTEAMAVERLESIFFDWSDEAAVIVRKAFVTPAIEMPMRFDMTRLGVMLDYAEDAMRAGGAPLYQSGGRIVHPVRIEKDADTGGIRRKAGALTVMDVDALRLCEYMTQHAPFERVTSKGDPKPFAPPLRLASHYLARVGEWNLPVLNGVIEVPTLRRNGSLLTEDGYDEDSGLLLDKQGVDYPNIPDRPNKAEAQAALTVLKEPFRDFPFVDDASRSVVLSAILTGLVRRSLYSAPCHGTSAPTMGTGKTLLLNCVSWIVLGRIATATSQGASEEEDEKRLFSVLLRGDPILVLDNVTRPIQGDALCTVLTEPTWRCRLLGHNREVEVRTNVLHMASGNNLTFAGDMTTRALVCRLDANMERPETRRFDRDLKTWLPAHRPEMVAAGLTVLRAFHVAGRPGLDKLEPFGRFEEWSNLVRGALVWLGEADPCDTRAHIAEDDPEREALARLMYAIDAAFPMDFDDPQEQWMTSAEIADRAWEDEDLGAAIDNAIPGRSSKGLGRFLKSKQGRIVGNHRIVGMWDGHRKVWLYRVQ
jgi:hypothetical protein